MAMRKHLPKVGNLIFEQGSQPFLYHHEHVFLFNCHRSMSVGPDGIISSIVSFSFTFTRDLGLPDVVCNLSHWRSTCTTKKGRRVFRKSHVEQHLLQTCSRERATNRKRNCSEWGSGQSGCLSRQSQANLVGKKDAGNSFVRRNEPRTRQEQKFVPEQTSQGNSIDPLVDSTVILSVAG